jgi:hypothetical protein
VCSKLQRDRAIEGMGSRGGGAAREEPNPNM